MDGFGKTDGLPIPPCCLITVFATSSPDTSSYLSYCIPIKGIAADTKEIFINRLLKPFTQQSGIWEICLEDACLFTGGAVCNVNIAKILQ